MVNTMPLRFHRQQLNGQALFIAKVCCVEVCSQQKLSITPMKSKRLKNWLRLQERQRELSHFRLRFSQKKRKLIEQGFVWAKTVGQIRQVMVHGLQRVDQMFVLTTAAYNLTRLRTPRKIRLQTL